ncbi:MAG: anthranilate synthase component I family protein [Syntrophomonadaceae bacterium]|nr:anthranilate synthase component I family protein [Syntrophomonadaceae bacterium]
MSRYEYLHASTVSRAGFCLPVSRAIVFPEQQVFEQMMTCYRLVPLYAQVKVANLDLAQYFHKNCSDHPACLLESLTGSDNGRYSIIAHRAINQISSRMNNPQGIKLLREQWLNFPAPELEFPFFTGGLIGYWSYETGLAYHELPMPSGNNSIEQSFFIPAEVIVYDRFEQEITVIIWTDAKNDEADIFNKICRQLDRLLVDIGSGGYSIRRQSPISASHDLNTEEGFIPSIDDIQFGKMVNKAGEYIRRGDIFQVVLSRSWSRKSAADPWQVYLNLRELNPSPYMFYFALPGFTLMGASPEMQIRVQKGQVKTRPIAGTRKVTGVHEIDQALGRELFDDEKERAEHLMLVDLSRNDIGRVSQPGTVRVEKFMQVEKFSHVMHLVSDVEGEMLSELDALDAFQAGFPAGTLSGAPKRKAMQIIGELETSLRGPYGGAVGYVDFNGNLDSCIAIRGVLHYQDKFYLQSGAGIVADSVPEMEALETLNKARALMIAIKEAE